MTSRSSIAAALQQITELKELKKDTEVTQSVLQGAKNFQDLNGSDNAQWIAFKRDIESSFLKLFESAKRCRLVATKKEKLCVEFHKFSVLTGFEICSRVNKVLEIKTPEILWQLLLERLFLMQLESALQIGSSSLSVVPEGVRQLTLVEENAIRYTAGYVIRQLERMYSKFNSPTQESTECIAALRKMTERLTPSDASQIQSKSCQWTKLIDRGGLYHVQDIVYELFVVIDSVVNDKVDTLLCRSRVDVEELIKENISWQCEDVDVQTMWDLIDLSNIEEEKNKQRLLVDIGSLWITTRTHSKIHKVKEDFKKQKKVCLKGKRSLRKELIPINEN